MIDLSAYGSALLSHDQRGNGNIPFTRVGNLTAVRCTVTAG